MQALLLILLIRMKIVILLGAPGSGKGTIASRLTEENSVYQHVSSGDLLRDAVKQQTSAGKAADGYMKSGELVPDAVIADMIRDYIAGVQGECTLLLDGFPRTVVQAQILDQVIESSGAELHAVVLMEVADEALSERISGRRICPKCGVGYHIRTIRPVKDGICDVCGTELITRKDDKPEIVKHRLAVYRDQTVPLIDYYAACDVLRRIIAVDALDENLKQVKQVLA